MATRDHTEPFIRMRSALNRRRPDAIAAATGIGDALRPDDSSPLATRVSGINSHIATISARMLELKRMHDDRLQISFEASSEREKEAAINDLTATITTHFNRCKALIEGMDSMASASASQEELKTLHNIKRGKATQLQDLSAEFKSLQKHYIGALDAAMRGASLGDLVGDTSGMRPESDEGFSDAQLAELAEREADVDERMREIQRIAKSVSELAKMFRELSVLVVEQGTILDRIDHNMDMAVERTKDGVANLVKAEEYQKSARPIICMTILMVLIVVCVIIIVVKASQKSG